MKTHIKQKTISFLIGALLVLPCNTSAHTSSQTEQEQELSITRIISGIEQLLITFKSSIASIMAEGTAARVIDTASTSTSSFSCPEVTKFSDIQKKNATNRDKRKQNVSTSERMLETKLSRDRESEVELTRRKENLIALMNEDPDLALTTIKNRKWGKALESTTKKCIESLTTVTGDMSILHADFLDKTTNENYFVTTSYGDTPERVRIHIPKSLLEKVGEGGGKRVTVKGYRIDNELVASDEAMSITFHEKSIFALLKEKLINIAHAVDIWSPLGPQTTLVINTYFYEELGPVMSNLQIDDVIFNKTNALILENSYNKTNLTGKTVGPYRLGIAKTCATDRVLDAAMRSLGSTVDPTVYKRIIIVAPMEACGWGGYGSIGNFLLGYYAVSPIKIFPASVSWLIPRYMYPDIATHELGHNLGLGHSKFIKCIDGTMPNVYPCDVMEYGDPYSIMGTSPYLGHFEAGQKAALGWLTASNIQSVTTGGDYKIEPYETPSSGVKVLRFSPGLQYSFEYRKPSSTILKPGVILHNVMSPTSLGQQSLLLDPHPPGDPLASLLEVNQKFTDAKTGQSATVISADATGAVIRIGGILSTTRISASPLTVSYGGTATIVWNSEGTSCKANWATAPVTPSGTMSLKLYGTNTGSRTYTYTIDCTNGVTWSGPRSVSVIAAKNPYPIEVCGGTTGKICR